MTFTDIKYIGLLSSRLEGFKQKNTKSYEFRCCYCGDSKKSKNKKRGYLYQIGNSYNFKCFNCSKSISFSTFLKDQDATLYKQYILEKFKEDKISLSKEKNTFPSSVINTNTIIKKKYFELPLISSLNKEHSVRKYLESRKIPTKYFDELYYCEKFKEWTNSQKHTFDDIRLDEPRIIIPLVNNEEIFGFQGRSLNKNSSVKYVTIMLSDDVPKIYNLDNVDPSKSIYVVEGPIDSMFLNNSIAMAGSDVNESFLSEYCKSGFVMVYDNEKRNKEIVRRMERTIDKNLPIVIWPNNLMEKDINDMVLTGHDVNAVVKSNTHQGLIAKVKFNYWKRI
jgi:hypothetical protein